MTSNNLMDGDRDMPALRPPRATSPTRSLKSPRSHGMRRGRGTSAHPGTREVRGGRLAHLRRPFSFRSPCEVACPLQPVGNASLAFASCLHLRPG